ncbi:MAG: hypothetical protein ACQESD_00885 [Thermoplasmatota archaeon]
MAEEIVTCDHKIRQEEGERKLVINCKECDGGFSLDNCLPGILLALKKEYQIDSIIISDYIERQYGGEDIELLKNMAELINRLERWTSRSGSKKQCSKCPIHPPEMYSDIRDSLLRDPGSAYTSLLRYSKELMKKSGCPDCRRSTKEEFMVLSKELLGLKSKILSEAYGVVG